MRSIFFRVSFILTVLTCLNYVASAQGMAVNGTGAAANSSAMLDVSSTTQGMLVPRMTSAQRLLISTPATGLLVYQTDGTSGFYFYNGSAWTSLSGGGGSPTGSAGGDLTGTYPNPTLGTSGVTAGTYGSSTQVPAYTVDAKGRITAAANTTITGVSPGGAAGGDLTGTFPNPVVNVGSITNSKVSATAAIAYSKLNLAGSVATTDISPTGASSGQVLGYNGTSVAWTTPSGGGSSGGSGAAPTSIPVSYSGHTGAAAWNSLTSSGQQLTLNGLACTVLPASLKPSMTIYSYSGTVTTWSIYTVTPSSSSATWTQNSLVISCTTGAAAGSTCSVTAPSNVPAGTILVLTSGSGAAPGGGGFLAVFSAQ